ncbi:MAG: TIGR03621 family F420-dependent LLM class oxidoreductase [Ilumatobacteraceae bacterium]
MPRPFRFALQWNTFEHPSEIATLARHAESLGYDELYSHDHIGIANAVDPFVPLMVAAAATTRLRVGPLVINNELHHPALLARTAATVDRLTEGRLVLGMGTGYSQDEHDAIGLELRPPRQRVERFAESLQVLRELLDGGASHVDGVHHHLDVSDLGVRPTQTRLPILVGGHGRRVLAAAAAHADIIQFTGLTLDASGQLSAGGFDLAAIVERARWFDEMAGDRNDDIERSTLVQHVDIADDAAGRVDAVAKRIGLAPDRVATCPFVFVGSVAQVIDQLERLREATGISHVVVRDPDGFAPVVAALAGH